MDELGEKISRLQGSVAGRAQHFSVDQQKLKEQQKDVGVTTIPFAVVVRKCLS